MRPTRRSWRALEVAGAVEPAAQLLDSAQRAHTFGSDERVRVETHLVAPGGVAVTWTEAPHPDPRRRLLAAVQLVLASEEGGYRALLDDAELEAVFDDELQHIYERSSALDLLDVALAPQRFPAGWGERAAAALVALADTWLGYQATHAYRKLWYPPGEDRFHGMGWGSHYAGGALRAVLAAWRPGRRSCCAGVGCSPSSCNQFAARWPSRPAARRSSCSALRRRPLGDRSGAATRLASALRATSRWWLMGWCRPGVQLPR